MKKNIICVMNNLNCGGAEKALISLLGKIDYNKYNVDLILFKHEGHFLKNLPEEVNLLPEPSHLKYFDVPIKQAIVDCFKKRRLDILVYRVLFSFIFKFESNVAICEQKGWKFVSKTFENIPNYYDVSIGYLEKNPIYFSVDKTDAKIKIGFIHTDYEKLGMDPKIDRKFFHQLDHIVTISEECKIILERTFPEFEEKFKVMNNIISPQIITKLSESKIETLHDNLIICSVGRLHHLKGFDMAIEACEILVSKGHNIKWFVIGEGEERGNLEKLIYKKGLQDNFILLGLKENPYPYIKVADIYVHPSRFEGKSIAIDEAKILRRPIVVTNFSTVKNQIENLVNGLVVNMNGKSLALGIEKLIYDSVLMEKLKTNLSKEQLGTEHEINKFYQLLI